MILPNLAPDHAGLWHSRGARITLLLMPPLLITLAAAIAGLLRSFPLDKVAWSLPSIFLLFLGFFGLARHEVAEGLAGWCRGAWWRPFLVVQLLLVPYGFYAIPLGLFSGVTALRLFAYLNLPILLLARSAASSKVGWADGVATLLIWLPLEFGWLGPVWRWPPGQSGSLLNMPMGVSLLVFSFVAVRQLDGVGYTFALRRHDLKVATICFLAFLPVGLGLGLGTGFLEVTRERPALLPSLTTLVGGFLMNGIPEELLFRGVIQNLLQRWIHRPLISLVVASTIFGVAHLNQGGSPDWRYGLLATLAGVAYGIAYRRGGNLMAPALTHALVNTLWSLGFRG